MIYLTSLSPQLLLKYSSQHDYALRADVCHSQTPQDLKVPLPVHRFLELVKPAKGITKAITAEEKAKVYKLIDR